MLYSFLSFFLFVLFEHFWQLQISSFLCSIYLLLTQFYSKMITRIHLFVVICLQFCILPSVQAAPTIPATTSGSANIQYAAIIDYQKNVDAQSVLNTIKRQLGVRQRFMKVLNVLKNTLNSNDFQTELQLNYSDQAQVKYKVNLVKSSTGAFSITKNDFSSLSLLDSKKLRKLKNWNTLPIRNNLQRLIKTNYFMNLITYPNLVQVQASEPYYVFTYNNAKGNVIKITVVYDIFKDQIAKIDAKEIKAVAESVESGYVQVDNWLFDMQARLAINFVQRYLGVRNSYAETMRVYKQKGKNNQTTGFLLDLNLMYSPKSSIPYKLYLSQSPTKVLTIAKSQFRNRNSLNEKDLKGYTKMSDIPISNAVLPVLQRVAKDKISSYSNFVKVDVNEPYFVFTLSKLNNAEKVQVYCLYDLVKNQVSQVNVKEVKQGALPTQVTQPVVSSQPAQSTLPTQTTQPVQLSRSTQPAQSTLPTQVTQPVVSSQPAPSSQPAQSTLPIQTTQPVQLNRSTQPVQSTLPIQSTQPAQSTQVASAQILKVVELPKTIAEAAKIETQKNESKQNPNITIAKVSQQPLTSSQVNTLISNASKTVSTSNNQTNIKNIQNAVNQVNLASNKATQPSLQTTLTPKKSPQPAALTSTSASTLATASNQTLNKTTSTKIPIFAELEISNEDVNKLLSGIPDSNLFPFLTFTLPQQDPKKLDSVIKFIIKSQQITDNFTVILANQLNFAVRVVIKFKKDNRLFEGFVSYIFKNNNKQKIQAQILVWRQIQSVLDISADIFSEYHAITPSSFLDEVIKKAFSKQESISKYKKLLLIQQKISFDGIYYRVNIEAVNGAFYQINLYWAPEVDYVQIQKYEILSNGYDVELQTKIKQIPLKDKYFLAAAQLLTNSFSNILKKSQLAALASHHHDETYNYRIVFNGSLGNHEAIVSVDSNLNTAITKWQKLDEGYVRFKVADFSTQESFKKLTNFVKSYVDSKIKLTSEADYFFYRSVDGLSKYFRLFFKKPFPFFVTIQIKNSDGKITTAGLQRLRPLPVSEYYNDRLFSSYTEINIKSFKTNQIYEFLLSSLKLSQDVITPNNSQLVIAFKKRTSLGIYYRLIFKAKKIYLVTFFHDITTDQYQTLIMEELKKKVQQGDYQWSCQTSDSKSGVCLACAATQQILSFGKCYPQLVGCYAQLGSTCPICNQGYLKNGLTCQKSDPIEQKPKPSIPQPPKNAPTLSKAPEQPPLTTISHELRQISKQSCTKFDGPNCINCTSKTYLYKGNCLKVEESCIKYNDKTGECLNCSDRNFIDRGVCKAVDSWCKKWDVNGKCQECIDGYKWQGNVCVVNKIQSQAKK